MNGSFLSLRVRQSTGSREHPGPRLPFRRLSLPLASFAPWVCHSGASLGLAIGGVCGTTRRLANASSGAPHGPARPEATPEDRTQTRPPPPTRPGTILGTEVPRDRQRFPSRDAGAVVGQTDHGPRKPGSVCDGDRAGTKGVQEGLPGPVFGRLRRGTGRSQPHREEPEGAASKPGESAERGAGWSQRPERKAGPGQVDPPGPRKGSGLRSTCLGSQGDFQACKRPPELPPGREQTAERRE